jgi:S-adenosylmethionine:tRNA ribosyltransferase-isomerase
LTLSQTLPVSPLSFSLPRELIASGPPEARGLSRDEIRLLIAGLGRPEHVLFRQLSDVLVAGDLLVVNTSATLPAAVDGSYAGGKVTVHFSVAKDDGAWVIELRLPDASGPLLDAAPGDTIRLPGRGRLTLLAPQDPAGEGAGIRLWRARFASPLPALPYLTKHGRPIAYDYVSERWPLEMYQTIFGREPGSAEMPSAGRPFTNELVTSLVAKGISFAPIVLHAGVSSLEAGEAPQPERFRVPLATARLVNHTRRFGGRVIAVGTTVTRAIESAACPDGTVFADEGWTDLILGPDRPARAVDGLITGWHAPEASHLLLLEAVAGRELVAQAYDAALKERYLWHEFGDGCLLLPEKS